MVTYSWLATSARFIGPYIGIKLLFSSILRLLVY